MRALALVALAGCGSSHHGLPDGAVADTFAAVDAATSDATTSDGSISDGAVVDGPAVDGSNVDGAIADAAMVDAVTVDAVMLDSAVLPDASVDAMITPDASPDASSSVITGGPCLSGAPGATGYRIRWAGNGAGSTAYVVYEVDGFPDKSRDHAAAYGYQIGFTPTWDDPFLGEGGLVLDDSDFIDLELTTVGVSTITKATLAIYGRSFNTTASGSFNWQTFVGTGATATNFVANSAPYKWYAADMTAALHGNDANVLLRIKAGPSSDSLIVNRVELCIQ